MVLEEFVIVRDIGIAGHVILALLRRTFELISEVYS
jgi:hypothetical protein